MDNCAGKFFHLFHVGWGFVKMIGCVAPSTYSFFMDYPTDNEFFTYLGIYIIYQLKAKKSLKNPVCFKKKMNNNIIEQYFPTFTKRYYTKKNQMKLYET